MKIADMIQNPPLIADPDYEYIFNLKLEPRAREFPPITSSSSKETAELLARPGAVFSAIFLNPEFHAPDSYDLIQQASKAFPNIPIFYLTDKVKLQFPERTLESRVVRKIILKPISYLEMVKTAHLFINIFSPEGALKSAAAHPEPAGTILAAPDSDFVPIRSQQFITGSMVLFDLHIRQQEGRYLKIVQAGADGLVNSIHDHLTQGTPKFYIRKTSVEDYVKYCDLLSAVLIRKPGLPAATKIGFVLNHGEEVLRLLRSEGPNESNIIYARRFVECARDFVMRLNCTDANELMSLFSSAGDFSRQVISVLVSLLLMKEMHFHSERSFEIVGLAALMQDVGLDASMARMTDEEILGLSTGQREIYDEHPRRGAQMLADIRDIDSAVIQAVEHHRDKIGESVFHGRLSGKFFNANAEIVGVCGRFARLLRDACGTGKVVQIMNDSSTSDFSSPVVEALKNLFLRRDDGTY